MTTMIAEAIEAIRDMSPAQNGRDSLITIKDPNGHLRHWLYNEGDAKYEPIASVDVVIQTADVSNVESFAALVREETLRRAVPLTGTDPQPESSRAARESEVAEELRHNGEFMTVTFSERGARFSPDDRVRLDSFTYTRTLSPQWIALTEGLNKPLEHKDLIRLLQRLRPSINGYEELMRHFRKIHFSDKTNIASEPLLTAGANANEFKVELEIKGGVNGPTTQATALPICLQYARGGNQAYTTTIEVDLSTKMAGERRELRFTLIAPDLPNVVEQAIDNEVAFFRSQVVDIPRLLILQDY